MILGYLDDTRDLTATSYPADPISAGVFRLYRPHGLYQWQFSDGLGHERLARELKDDHSLTLFDPAAAGNDIVLKPGAGGGITVKGATLLDSLSVAGGFGVQGGIVGNSLFSAGAGSSTGGLNSVAIGGNAHAFSENGIAIGTNTYTDNHSAAFGTGSQAGGASMALGFNAMAHNSSFAIGWDTQTDGYSCMVLHGGQAYGWLSMGVQFGQALQSSSFAATWSHANGESSTALAGGYTGGYQSFAANCGVAYADYANALGRGTVARLPYQTVLGTYNQLDYQDQQSNPDIPFSHASAASDPVFVVGNGTLDPYPYFTQHRSNAFSVAYNGDTKVQGGLTVAGEPAAAAGPHGLSMTVQDYVEGSNAVSVGRFLLHRADGKFQWRISRDSPRTAMELNNDHSLALFDPAHPDDLTHAIVFTPGAVRGITFNGTPLATTDEPGLTVGGGLLVPPGVTEATPGLAAIGSAATAYNLGAVAIGMSSSASAQGSFAIGQQASATALDASALGYNSLATATGATGVGSGSHALGAYSVSLGAYSTTYGVCSFAAGNAYTWNDWGVAINGLSHGSGAFASCWGQADGDASVTFGGYAGGAKSFAGNSGVAWGTCSTAIGRGTVAQYAYQCVLGTYTYPGTPPTRNPGPDDFVFVVGNGSPGATDSEDDDVRSNALTVAYNGNAHLQGALTVDGLPGVPSGTPTTSVFNQDVKVNGVLRVNPAGDIGMGSFTAAP